MTHYVTELNGIPADPDALRALALTNYGHFTSMQAVAGAVRGLDLHLDRLQRATAELFGAALARERVRGWMRQAVAATGGAVSLRVTVYSRAFRRDRPADAVPVDVLVATSPARAPAVAPLRVRSVRYEREAPHLKHVGTFGLFHQRRLAQLAGFDDALFVDATGAVSEGSVWNVGFFDGSTVVWPDAPALDGVSMQLLREGMRGGGVPMDVRRVGLDRLGAFRSAFFTNTSCVAMPIASIDDHAFARDAELEARLHACMAAHPLVAI